MKRTPFSVLLAACAVVACGFLTSIGFAQVGAVDTSKPQLTINAYSGMPNPAVRLTADDVKLIQEMADKLPADAAPKQGAPSLKAGYAGFVIGPLPGPNKASHTLIQVYRTSVEVRTFFPSERRATAVIKIDSNQSLEKYLTQFAAAKGLLQYGLKERIGANTDVREPARQ